ncbi:MAG: Gfo/Idh/MocA family oxidoreductase [Defluviitaleaceae bacterium]|nr:Gfo/Idh/MocA family oxidoreductase [Defluviitaleaceae bacterium]MCL2835521.1 Gfo/Idh/MocA family oxidoreductase [Defluviitaleaceae bacterium]
MIGVALIGTGDISGIYLKNITQVFRGVNLIGVCDLIGSRAEKGAAYVSELNPRKTVKIYKDMYEAFNDPDVSVILNLTRPGEHYGVSRQALLHGKHVYAEKPISVSMEEATELLALAKEKNLLMGGAPDTFMGAGIQTCRKLIDGGIIGDVIGADCAMICRGHETWHPDPEFYYKRGGGPMLDMGPYYLTGLLNLLGEAKGVTGMTKRSFKSRPISSQPRFGEIISVDEDTYAAGCIEFTSGAVAQVITTFDVHYTTQARFEVYGTEGTMIVPDPNTFGGPILLYRREDAANLPSVDPALIKPEEISLYRGYRQIPLMFGYRENSRGLGLADMCRAIESKRLHRANSEQQIHVLEIMTAFGESSRQKRCIDLKTKYTRAEPMKNADLPGVLE